jgi:hypothetical protein
VGRLVKRSSPRSRSGLIETMVAPRRRIAQFVHHARVVGGRVLAEDQQRVGMLEIPSVTVPLPMPTVPGRPRLVGSWHMFEQSGKLLVPYMRTNSWNRKAASLLVRPEV